MASKSLGFISKMAIPAAVGLSLVQASIYDVKGGNRAVIFDRLSGVRETVGLLQFLLLLLRADADAFFSP
jgi:prohibitin 1